MVLAGHLWCNDLNPKKSTHQWTIFLSCKIQKRTYFQCIFGIIYPQNLSFFNKNPVRQFFTPKAP